MAVGFGFPMTVAGPRRICTGFPLGPVWAPEAVSIVKDVTRLTGAGHGRQWSAASKACCTHARWTTSRVMASCQGSWRAMTLRALMTPP